MRFTKLTTSMVGMSLHEQVDELRFRIILYSILSVTSCGVAFLIKWLFPEYVVADAGAIMFGIVGVFSASLLPSCITLRKELSSRLL